MSNQLSLGIVTGSMSRAAGGLFNSVRNSALQLAQLGMNVSVYAQVDEYSSEDFPAWEPLKPNVLPVRLRSLLPHSPELPRRLAQADHDVLHLHGIWQLQSRSVNMWKRSTGRPVMISPRGMLDPWALANSGWKKKIAGALFENRNLREADCLHALNASEACSFRAFGLSQPIAMIPNATGIPDMGVRAPHEGLKKLLFCGRIHPKKGLEALVSAWAMACKRRPSLATEWQLMIAGWDDGGYLEKLKRHIASSGAGRSVILVGPSFGREKDSLLRDADAFILPSYSEGLPMSVLEAWAYRLPVLMTQECNLPEGFEKGAAIKISTSPDEMSETMLKALLDTNMVPLGEAGRSLVEEHFSWAHVADRHNAVYEWMCRGGKPPTCVDVVRS